MGIMNHHLRKISQCLRASNADSHLRLAFLGYPDVALSKDVVVEAFGEQIESDYSNGYDLVNMLKDAYDCSITIFDVAQHRGMEQILDLNEPLPENLCQAFDLVIDSSCLEHCFNVAQAFKNICEMTAVTGYVITIAPIYLFNHGYYNISPIMHQDGFEHNGFELISQNLINNNGEVVTGFSPKKTPPRQIFILSTAKKICQQTFRWPLQSHKGLGVSYE